MKVRHFRNSKPDSGGAFDYESILQELFLEAALSLGVSVETQVSNDFLANNSPKSFGAGVKARLRQVVGRAERSADSVLLRDDVDLVYFSSPSILAREILSVPAILTMWDLGHRDLPEFPEFRGGEWFTRENLYRDTLPRAFHVFTDSLETGERLEKLYGVLSSRWSPLGLPTSAFQAPESQVPTIKTIEVPFVFYPAGFWPHKNHILLLDILENLNSRGILIHLVVCGPDKGNRHFFSREVEKRGLESQVSDLGFLTNEEVDALYRGAVAIVMPSFLGPTNLPPIRALQLGTPALVSSAHAFGPDFDSHLTALPPDSALAWADEIVEILKAQRERASMQVSSKAVTLEIARVLAKFISRRRTWRA